MDQIFYESVFHALNHHQVRYVVVGGIAVNLLGIPRLTKDLDIMLDLSEGNLQRFVHAMKQLGYRCRAPVAPEEIFDPDKRKAWVTEKGAVIFTFHDPSPPCPQVVIFLDNPIDFEQAYARKQDIKAGDITIPLVCAEDLIQMKQRVNRLQDQADIAMIRKIQNERAER